jgi:hypothetical protein
VNDNWHNAALHLSAYVLPPALEEELAAILAHVA